MMEGDEGIMVVYPAGRATLAVLVGKDAQMSRVLYGTQKTAQDVEDVLES
jgi:predicted regulator of Ras-like GTPase activity (Roadblock/LC7/MglB family)